MKASLLDCSLFCNVLIKNSNGEIVRSIKSSLPFQIVDTVAEVAEIADDLAGKVFGDGDDDDGKEELVNNLPLKSKDPKV